MSFGFSVGDIVLLSKFSLQIYQTVTSGRKNASRDLEELGDVLFGFQCGLDHLSKVANQISQTDSPAAGDNAQEGEMRKKLDQMIRQCAKTLEDLDTATRKYREDIQPGNDSPVQNDSNVTQRAKLKSLLASNYTQIRWEINKDTLKIYRDRLQAHTDAINLVLNSFVWSNSSKIDHDNKVNQQKLSHLHDEMISSNMELAQLVKEIHASVTTQSTLVASAQRGSGVAIPQRSMESKLASVISNNVPLEVQALNAKRQVVRSNALAQHSKPGTDSVAAYSLRSTARQQSAKTDLIEELDVIFRHRGSIVDASKSGQVQRWVKSLDNMFGSSTMDESPDSRTTRLVKVLVHLNELLDTSDEAACESFYTLSAAAKINTVLERLASVTESVRVMKEIEDFHDTRKEWEQNRG